jgi:hypothetical protein
MSFHINWACAGASPETTRGSKSRLLYRLTVPAAIPNMQPSFNVCPTDPVAIVVAHEGNRELVQIRWGLVPYWWNKPLKELRLATFNARIETVTTKPFFREPVQAQAVSGPCVRLLRVAGHSEGKTALVLHRARWLAVTDGRRSMGPVEK